MSKAEKYIDLGRRIADNLGKPWVSTGMADVLRWLDRNPEQVPGRTMTESEISKAFGPEYVAWARLCLARIGITVVPDPEPTNVERLRALYMEWEREGPRTLAFAEWMDIRGVTAPGDDDD